MSTATSKDSGRPDEGHERDADRDVHLRRALGLPALTLFGLVYLVPLTVFTTYGLVTNETGGRVALSYVVTLAAMVFTALSYAQMVRAYPVSGSAYTYTQQSFGGHAGFLTGWALLLDYIFLPMLNYLVMGIYLNTELPGVPVWVWAVLAVALVTALNVVGITTIAKMNVAIIAAQTAFIIVFVALCAKAIGGGGAPDVLAPFRGDGSVAGWGPVLAGSAILCLSFLGFDAVSTMAEEARRPRIDIPRAILTVTIGGGVIFILLSALSQLALPTTSFHEPDNASVEVMRRIGGDAMQAFFVAAYVAGCFGSALTSQASVTRIMYTMGRDGVLPRVFAFLHPRWRTPVVAIVLVSAISLASGFVSLAVLASMVSFGALVAFTAVNAAVVKHYALDEGRRHGVDLLRFVVAPLVGVALTVWLWTSLSGTAITVGLGWVAVGVVWLAVLTGGFRRRPPTMDFSEVDHG